MENIEYILDFVVLLGREMIACGANLERVSLAVDKICDVYNLREVTQNLSSNYISVSARTEEGLYCFRDSKIPNQINHLMRLRNLNRLSFRVSEIQPAPRTLNALLRSALMGKKKDYETWQITLSQILAMVCLCIMFGGRAMDVFGIVLIVLALTFFNRLLAHQSLNRMLANAVVMFGITVLAILLGKLPIGIHAPVLIITIIMLVLPGIPMVNAARNILCGNEMNGILQLIKVGLETLSLAFGIFAGAVLLKSELLPYSVTLHPVLMIVLSFLASASFGVAFHIYYKDLTLAGICGVLCRVVLLLSSSQTENRTLFVLTAAFVSSLFAELLATRRREPSTYLIYPSIVPIIPGDLLYFTVLGFYLNDAAMVQTYGISCVQSLLGMSIGFVLSSTVANYIRRRRHFLNRIRQAERIGKTD